jgi:hypothetical protein
MSKLSEYIKLLPRALKNADKIIDGLRNQLKLENGTLPKDQEDVIIGRRLICSQCPFNSTNATAAKWYASSRNDVHCTQCGCPIDIRTASLEANCGIEEYNKQHSDNPILLKWAKIETKP